MRMPGGEWGRRLALNFAGVALFLLGWQGADVLVGQYLPPPAVVIQAAYQNLWSCPHFVGLGLPAGGYWPHLVSTTGTAILGCAIGGLVGTASVALTVSTAQEVAASGVTVNCVCPGPTDTPLWRACDPEWNAWKLSTLPIKRIGTPKEVAWAYVFLASDEATYMIGHSLSPNGGDVMW